MTLQNEIGFATVVMGEAGPETEINLSELDEMASIFLAVKGFTAFMTGFERDDFGPGKIRGILQIPKTTAFAIAFDHNTKGLGTEEDQRLAHSRMTIICLIVSEKDLSIIRKYYAETEKFLANELESAKMITDLTEEFIATLKKKYNQLLQKLLTNTEEQQTEEEKTLFDLTVLLSLPKEENVTARAVLQCMNQKDDKGVAVEEICKITKRRKKREQKILQQLMEKGLIVGLPKDNDYDELLYLAK
jgi:hypothetical protein